MQTGSGAGLQVAEQANAALAVSPDAEDISAPVASSHQTIDDFVADSADEFNFF